MLAVVCDGDDGEMVVASMLMLKVATRHKSRGSAESASISLTRESVSIFK